MDFRPDFEIEGLFDTAYVLYSQAEMVSLASGSSLGRQEAPYFNRTVEHFCSHQHAPDSGEAAGSGLLYAVPVKRGSGSEIIEDITPVYHTNVRLKLPKTIKRVYLAPQRTDIRFTQKDGVVEFQVDEVYCHQMVVLEY